MLFQDTAVNYVDCRIYLTLAQKLECYYTCYGVKKGKVLVLASKSKLL